GERVGRWRVENRRTIRRIQSRIRLKKLAHVAPLRCHDGRGLAVILEQGHLSPDAEIVGANVAADLAGLVAERIEDLEDLAQGMKAGAKLRAATRRFAG